MRAVRRTFSVAIIVGACGCSSADTGGGRFGNAAKQPTSTLGAGGIGAGAAGTAAGSGFGNPGMQPVAPPRPAGIGGASGTGAGGAAGACKDGVLCASMNADTGCGTLTLSPTVKMEKKPGNVLLVWDRSTSMTSDWNGMQRWQAAGGALIAALMPLVDDLKIGAIFFPSVVSSGMQRDALAGAFSCDVDAYSAPGQIPFTPGAQFLQTLAKADPAGVVNPIYSAGPAQATPTYAALAEADKMIQNATLQGTLAVVLVTDGEPTCTDWDQNAATKLAANWLTTYGAKTYVVGLPSNDIQANGQAVLNAVAQAGGTMKYIDPSNPASLQMQINQIISTTISSSFDSCSLDLPPTAVPDMLQLVVEEPAMPGVQMMVPRDLGTAGGWNVTTTMDAVHVELVGDVCSAAKSGSIGKITFMYGCKSIPPIKPQDLH